MKVGHGSMRRRALTWSLTISSTLTLAFWLASLVWSFDLLSPGGVFAVSHGAVIIVRDTRVPHEAYLVDEIRKAEFYTDLVHDVRMAKFFMTPRNGPLIWFVKYSGRRPPGSTSGSWECAIPLWPVVLMTGIPGAWLWATRPRRQPGDCPACGYDRRGIDGSGGHDFFDFLCFQSAFAEGCP